jgi:hypothetical protein
MLAYGIIVEFEEESEYENTKVTLIHHNILIGNSHPICL